MDLASICKDKLAYFRIKELKDVLTQLGLSKQGKKQDLVDRVLAIISDDQVFKTWTKKHGVSREHVAKLVDDTYRKMQISGAPDLASKGQGASESNHVKIKGEIDDSFQPDTKVRCLCGGKLETEPLIKCEDRRCHVWQHIGCVIIPEKPLEGNPPIPDVFYCEICRLNRADPFWVSVAHPLFPVKLSASNPPPDGTNPVQSLDRTFHLKRADKDLLSKSEYDLQAWCMLLSDKVPFRMQWPQYADLQVNGMAVRAINRPGSQLLGANGRDDGPIITQYTKDGSNKISLTSCDARIFCLGVRIVKRRTMQQIMNMIPKEGDGELFEDALARVRRCVSGGNATDNADSDSDIVVVADSFSIDLRCPMSGSRMKVAGRFKPCLHMGCFDLEVFVEMNQRSRKWQCPICLKNYSLEHLIIDPYFNRITSRMRHCGEDITEIEVKPDCSWRVKTKTESERRELLDLAQYHFPDGSLCAPETEIKPKSDALKQVKQRLSDSHTGLKLGIRKNCNGFWEFSKHEDINISSGSRLHENIGVHEQKVIPMSSTATGSGREGDDASVNQDAGAHFDLSTSNGVEMDSLSLNAQSAYGFTKHNPSSARNAEVIVLSDSDEDNDILISSSTTYKNTQNDMDVGFTIPPPGINDPYPETLGNSSGMDLFNPNEDEFMSLWPLHPGTQTGPGFQLFGSDAEVPDALIHLQRGPVNCTASVNGYAVDPASVNGYAVDPDASMGPTSLIPDASAGLSDAYLNGSLVDIPLAFAGEDPSLQIFLPTRPLDASIQPDLRDPADVSNAVRNEDWISLRLGDGATGNHEDLVTPNLANTGPQIPSSEASLLLGISDNRSDKASRLRSDSPFSFPRQKRSVRPRLYLSIDSDSD